MGKWLRRVGLALLCSLLAGFALGTCIRLEAERPTEYIGDARKFGDVLHRNLWTAVHGLGRGREFTSSVAKNVPQRPRR